MSRERKTSLLEDASNLQQCSRLVATARCRPKLTELGTGPILHCAVGLHADRFPLTPRLHEHTGVSTGIFVSIRSARVICRGRFDSPLPRGTNSTHHPQQEKQLGRWGMEEGGWVGRTHQLPQNSTHRRQLGKGFGGEVDFAKTAHTSFSCKRGGGADFSLPNQHTPVSAVKVGGVPLPKQHTPVSAVKEGAGICAKTAHSPASTGKRFWRWGRWVLILSAKAVHTSFSCKGGGRGISAKTAHTSFSCKGGRGYLSQNCTHQFQL